jgi:hypothetical protein
MRFLTPNPSKKSVQRGFKSVNKNHQNRPVAFGSGLEWKKAFWSGNPFRSSFSLEFSKIDRF